MDSSRTEDDDENEKGIRVEEPSIIDGPNIFVDVELLDEREIRSSSVEIIESYIPSRQQRINRTGHRRSYSDFHYTSSKGSTSSFSSRDRSEDELYEATNSDYSEDENEYFIDSEEEYSIESSNRFIFDAGSEYTEDSEYYDSLTTNSSFIREYDPNSSNALRSDDSEIEIIDSVVSNSNGRNSSVNGRQSYFNEDSEVEILESIFNNPVISNILLPISFYMTPNIIWNEDMSRPVNYDLITDEFITNVKEKVKQITDTRNMSSLYSAVRDLIQISSAYSRFEISYLQGKVRSRLVDENHPDPSISGILQLIFDWRRLDFPRGRASPIQKIKYKSVIYKNLMNVTEKSCSICYQDFKLTVRCCTMECRHIFHTVRLNKWLKD